MRRRTALKPAAPARDRILDAASRRFSRHSYEETGLRDVAADARVDVAYVHRCFGSKEQLFAKALAATVQPDHLLAGPVDALSRILAKQPFARDAAGAVQPLDIVVRSLASPEATGVVHEFITQDFVGPLADKLGQPMQLRAALIAAFLVGVGILRNVVRIKPLLEGEGGEAEKLIESIIEDMMGTGPAIEDAATHGAESRPPPARLGARRS